MAWLSGWSKRIKLTIDHTRVDADLTHFPVTVILSSSQGEEVFSELGADAKRFKIAFTKADEETQLYAEIEQFDYANSKAVFHVSASGWAISSSADTGFYLYYDADHADNTTYIGDIDSTPGHSVWDSNFKFVCHMVDYSSTIVRDSTSNGKDGTKANSNQPNEVTGKVAEGQDFDGTDDKINLSSTLLANPDAFTMEAIFYHDGENSDDDNQWQTILDLRAQYQISTLIFEQDDATYPGSAVINMYDGSVSTLLYSSQLNLSTWYHFTGTYDGTTQRGYIDGAQYDSCLANTPAEVTTSVKTSRIGKDYSEIDRAWFNGKIDEVRISDTGRPAAWLKATYNSLWDSLLTYGDEETPSGDVTLSIPVLASSAALLSTLNLQLALPAMAGQGTLSMDQVFFGRFVPCEPFSSVSSLAGNLNVNLILPVLASQSTLNGNAGIQLLSPALTAQGILSLSDIFIGRYVSVPAFNSTGNMNGDLGIQLFSPALTGQGGLLAAPRVRLVLDPFVALASLGMASINKFNTENAEIKYTFVLTGTNDDATDITIPMSSFQARLRSGDPTYLSIVVPGMDYASAISARPNGEMIVYMHYYSGGLLLQTEEIIRVDLEDINISQGAGSTSIVLTGHKTQTTGGKTVMLRNLTYRNLYQGKFTYRCATPDIFLKPGDTVICGDDEFAVDFITCVVSVAQQSMEVSGT